MTNYQQTIAYTRDFICVKYFLVIWELCLSIHEEQRERLVGILSGNTCLCLQMLRSKTAKKQNSCVLVYCIYLLVFILEKTLESRYWSNESKINHKIKTLLVAFMLVSIGVHA